MSPSFAHPLRRRHLVALASSLTLFALSGTAQAQEAINIGAVLSLTGANATVGEDVRRGVLLGIEHVNAKGGVMGRKLNLIVEDSGGNPTTALSAARKLATVDKVPVVMGEYSSGITLPMAQYLVKEGVTHLNIASSSNKVRDIGATSFSFVGLEAFGNKFSAADTYAMGLRKVAVIAPNNAYGQGVLEGYKQEFEKLGGKVVTEVLYTAGQSTYRRELQQMSRSKPDGYVYTAYGQESAVINREAEELGLRKVPWYAILMSMSLSDTPAATANGQIGMELGSLRGATGKNYSDAFTAKYNAAPKTAYTGYGYDAVLMTAAAIEKAKSVKPADIQAALRDIGNTGFDGVTGNVKFDADRQRVDPPYDKLKFENGKLAPR